MKNKSNFNTAAGILWLFMAGGAQAALPLDPLSISKYLDPLPLPAKLKGGFLEIAASEFTQQVLPSDFNAGPHEGKTVVWGYNGSYPGPTIDMARGASTIVKWVNNLTDATLYKPVSGTIAGALPVGQTLNRADPLNVGGAFSPYGGQAPMVTHLHGAMVRSGSDGHPGDWFTPESSPAGKKYKYLNDQPAATLWYHDHAVGVTRLNVYAGLAGFYLLRDDVEKPLRLPGNALDHPKYEREIMIQDKSFDQDGQLLFPGSGVSPADHPFWIPEFLGNTIVVNGKAWPYLEVEPRRYRFRLLNGSNARFYTLSFANELPFWQIGADAGLLDKPVRVPNLILAPGERADVIVDFSGVADSVFILNNTSNAPSPGGGAADPETTGQVMQFRVGTTLTRPDETFNPARIPTPILRADNRIVRLTRVAPANVTTRILTLNEVQAPNGSLKTLLDGKEYGAPVSEKPKEGATEIWEIVNLTADTHPMHLHLAPFQLLGRQKIDVVSYRSAYDAKNPVIPADYTTNPELAPYLVGQPQPPDENENGWKDTVRMNPGEVTRIAIRFAPTETPANDLNGQFPFDPSVGPGFVWHCHILDHEDNEMMRPYQVRRQMKLTK